MPEQLELKLSVYQSLRNGEFEPAEELILQGLEHDLHNPDLEKILKMIKFWQNRKEFFSFKESSGEKLYQEWDKFIDFCRDNKLDLKKAFLSIKDFIFRKTIDLLIDAYRLSPMPERDTLILLGQAFYEVGMVDKAIETLEYAMSIATEDEDVRIYTLLGNLYAGTEDKDLAMVMFNEAFLKFPQLINLEDIDFPPVQNLRKMVEADGFRENEVPEWIPIYGYIFEGLTTRKKMEYKDMAELKEKIADYEKSAKLDKKVIHIILPRLINFYLWLLDYYLYQVKALNPAQSVIKRIRELMNGAALDDKIRQKLLGRTELLFKRLLSQVSEVAALRV